MRIVNEVFLLYILLQSFYVYIYIFFFSLGTCFINPRNAVIIMVTLAVFVPFPPHLLGGGNSRSIALSRRHTPVCHLFLGCSRAMPLG